METLFLVYWVVGFWVWMETEDIASAILWPRWAWKKVNDPDERG